MMSELETTGTGVAADLATPHRSSADYIDRTIETVRNHRDADNCWPQWANIFADEIEDLRADAARVEAELSRLREERDALSEREQTRATELLNAVADKVAAVDQLLSTRHVLGKQNRELQRRAEAAEAECARLQQALGNLLPLAQLDDPWSQGVERYRQLLAQAREALAGPDTPVEEEA